MTDTDNTPEDEYAEDREQPEVSLEIPFDEPEADVLEQRQEVPSYQDEVSLEIPFDEPEADVLEQRQEVPLYQDEDEPWWDKATEEEEEEDDEDEDEGQ